LWNEETINNLVVEQFYPRVNTPVRSSEPRKLLVPYCIQVFVQVSWFLTNPLVVHSIAVKKLILIGRNGYQSSLMVSPTPFQVHRSGQVSGKEFVAIKFYIILHDVVGGPG
jgi:hypothetical protein